MQKSMRNFRILKLTSGSKRAYWMMSAVGTVSSTAKLMLISDQARDLLQVILKAGIYVSLSKWLVYIWDLESIDCQQSLHVMIYVRVIERE